MSVLLIAESREKGEKIASAIGLNERGQRLYRGIYNHQQITLCWASGHLFEPIPPEAAKPDCNWREPTSLLPLPMPGRMQLSSRGKDLFYHIKGLLSQASEVWIGTDGDNEGEAIGRDILKYAKFNGPIKRLWLSGALEKKDLEKAIKEIQSSEAKIPGWRAQQARQGADWLWQFLVRGYTIKARNGLMGSNLGTGSGAASVASVGRVQSVTLSLVVNRDAAIERFKPINHFVVSPHAGGVAWSYIIPKDSEIIGKSVQYDDAGNVYFISKEEAEDFAERLRSTELVVTKADKGAKTAHPPLPHSLTSLQQVMNRRYKMTSKKTLEVADAIRLEGYLTYPRTEHGELPISLYSEEDLHAQLKACAVVPGLNEPAQRMIESHPTDTPPKCYTTKDMEHHGIIPTGKIPDLKQWDKNKVNVFTECAKALVIALHPPAQYDTLTLEGFVETEGMTGEHPSEFKRRVEQLISPGWKNLDPKEDDEEASNPLPWITAKQSLPITQADIQAKKTTPPKPYTEATLLSAMLNAGREAEGEDAKLLNAASGIGTPATRAAIIETLQRREYVEVKKGAIRSTPKGRDLIKYIPPTLASVTITASWERTLREIGSSKGDDLATSKRNQFLKEQMQFVTHHIEEIIESMTGVELKGGRDTPTEGMIKFAKAISKQVGVELGDALSTFDGCKAFIDTHKSKMPAQSDNPPTPKMIDFATSLAKEKGIELGDALSTFDNCKEFINQHNSGPTKGAGNPPTPKMISFATSLAKEKGVELGDALSTFDGCREFINKHSDGPVKKSDNPPTPKMIELAKKLSKEKGVKLGKDTLVSFDQCKAFIGKLLGN